MKTLKHLEKKRFVWFLIGLSTIFFLLRLPSLIEPNWYGDEGIYQVISLAMHSGWDLYADIWDNKPPLLYVTYALFGGDQFSVRLLSVFFGMSATIVFFFLARLLFNNDKTAGIAATVFAFLFATPFLEGNIANAENFMLLLVITAGLLIYSKSHKPFAISYKLVLAGFLLGVAFLYKIVALFDFVAFCLFLILATLPDSFSLRKEVLLKQCKTILPMLFGFLLPIVIAFLFFTINGTLIPFVQSAFFGNIGYVGYGNHFIIPQGLLVIKFLLFLAVVTVIVLKRKLFTKPLLFMSLWFTFTVFSAFFSQRPYTHYVLVMLPTACLLMGLLFTKQSRIIHTVAGVSILFVVFVAYNYFHVYGISKTFQYYNNAITFLTGQKNVHDYQAFFDPDTPRDYEVVSYISTRLSPTDHIFIWGDSPQIYYLLHKLPPNKYTVSYHILQDPTGIVETQAAIDKTQPKFIITLSEAPPIPFQLPQYVGTYGIKGSTIYERTY